MSSFSKCCFATKLLHKVPKLPATNQLDQSGLEGSTISMCFRVWKGFSVFFIYFLVFILSTSVYWVMVPVCQLNLLWHLTRQVSEKWRWHCPPLAACREMQCCQKDPSERAKASIWALLGIQETWQWIGVMYGKGLSFTWTLHLQIKWVQSSFLAVMSAGGTML